MKLKTFCEAPKKIKLIKNSLNLKDEIVLGII
jgi:hypothetical protein